MHNFANDKKNCLNRMDKSKKGFIDNHIEALVDLINEQEFFYTTSSCSGRIMLMAVPSSGKKNEYEWIFPSHDEVDFEELKKAVDSAKGNVWFKQESFILHVCCKTIEHAQQLMDICRELGLKRSGIIGTKKRITVEIIGSENLSAPVCKDGVLLIDDSYLKTILEEANQRMIRNQAKIKGFFNQLKIA